MDETLATNLRLRIAHLGKTWEELAQRGGEDPRNVRAWVRRATPTQGTLKRLARLLGVPEHALLDPEFNPRDYDPPTFDTDGGNACQESG